MKASTLKTRKELKGKKLFDPNSFIIAEDSQNNGKKHSTPTLIQNGQQAVQHTTATGTLYDSVALDIPSMPKGNKSNNTPHVGHYRKKEQKKTFIDNGCKTLDRNHFSRIRVSQPYFTFLYTQVNET
jgi:hypothetical protein